MFAEVVPLRRFNRSRGVFDYQIPASLSKKVTIGQVVSVQFLKSQNLAIVTNIKKESDQDKKKLKPIEKIVNLPLLPEYLIELAFWLAEWSAVSPATVFKMIVPVPPQKTYAPTVQKTASRNLKVSLADAKVIQSLLAKTFLHKTHQQKCLTIFPTKKSSLGFLIKLCQSAKVKNKNIAIVFPTINHCQQLFQYLSTDTQKQVSIVTSGQSKSEKFNNWKNIAQGKTNIVLGAKIALFAPFLKLNQIVIVEEENRNHKQEDQNPRFHARSVAEKLAELTKANLLLLTYSPSLEAYLGVKKNQFNFLETKIEDKKVTLVNKKDEFLKKNYSPLSDQLENKIKAALAQKEKIFLFLNRRGIAAALSCANCGEIIKCPVCQQTLTLQQKDQLFCPHCLGASKIPLKCSHCPSYNFKKIGWGTKRLVNEVGKKFPRLSICRLDQDNKTIDFKAQLFIGTEKAFSYLMDLKPSLIGVISADSLLSTPDFRAAERTYQLLKNLMASLPKGGEIIIQTFSVALPLFQAIVQNQAKIFYESELKNRDQLAYPPTTKIIKLLVKDRVEEKIIQQTTQLIAQIKSIDQGLDIFEPLSPGASKKEKGKFTKILLIKIPHETADKIISKIIKQVPENWIIDREPLVLYY